MLACLSLQYPALLSLLLGEPRVSTSDVLLILNVALVKINRTETDTPPAIRLSVVSSKNDVREAVILDTFQRSRLRLGRGRYEDLAES